MKNQADKRYIKLIKRVLSKGIESDDRTGVGTISLFGERSVYNLKKGFPLISLKKVWFKGVMHELIWFLKGDTNIKYLVDNNVHIWDAWADEQGNLGPVYGKQWRDWNGMDQIKTAIDLIKNEPSSRRIVVSAWNVSDLKHMALPPCHMFFQFSVQNGKLSCQIYQRSADLFLGVPFNIASYALLTHVIAHLCELEVDKLIHVMGDCHIYKNHIPQCQELVRRFLTENPRPTPVLEISNLNDISELQEGNISLIGYNPLGKLSGEVAV
jgi:thymidylate synthase